MVRLIGAFADHLCEKARSGAWPLGAPSRTLRRRWARAAGRGAAREPPWVLQVGAVGGQVRPSGAAAASLRPRFLVQRDQEAPRAAP